MADNIAGQTRTNSDKQDSPAVAQGSVVYDATAITAADSTRVLTGFKPRYVRWVNLTDRVEVEWFEGMTANTCMKTAAAGTRTLHRVLGGGAGSAVRLAVAYSVVANAWLICRV